MTTKKVTKAKVLRQVARSMAKWLKARGYEITINTVLDALAAADGSKNWHVFVKKAGRAAEQNVHPVQPETIWVGVHTHRYGTNIYVGLTFDAVFAHKWAIALENIDRELPEYKDEGLTTDQEKVNYYWAVLAEKGSEWFEISESDVEAEGETAGRNLTPVKSNLETHKMLVATTAHVTWEEAQHLNENGYERGEYGWLLYIKDLGFPVADIKNPSAGLMGAIETARQAGCAYLLLDRDADPIEGVPTYDW